MSIIKKKNRISKYIDKLYFKQWTIGFSRANLKDVIRTKTFNPDISWVPVKSFNHFYADPFVYKTRDGNFDIICEDYNFNDRYGKIASLTFDQTFKQINHKIILDTKSHLSYPFIFLENNKIYVFPEAGRSGHLSCYEYVPSTKSLIFLQVIIDLPVVDATILNHDNKYWLFGTLRGADSSNKLYLFFSDNLFGPYTPHNNNPVKNALNGARPAGNFIEVDGIIYRPSQNSENRYGESITIHKITVLNEIDFIEEPYMTISMNKENFCKYGIHTINAADDIIVVDGQIWTFSPLEQLKYFVKKNVHFSASKRRHYLKNSC